MEVFTTPAPAPGATQVDTHAETMTTETVETGTKVCSTVMCYKSFVAITEVSNARIMFY